MDEEECIKVLINNKKEGKAYMFLPIEVKNWLWDYEEEMENYELKEFDSSGEWVSVHTEKDWHSNNGVYCLEKRQDSVLIEQRRNKMDDIYTDKQVCEILGDNHFSNLLQYVLHMFGTMPISMTEEEIIQYLKMNKKIGIAFKFMPEEVKEWCRKYSKKLYWYDMDILVDCWSNGGFEKRLYDDKVYALSEDFKMEENLKGEWVEFNIDKNGDFEICGIANDKNTTIIYNWSQWNKPIRDNASKNFINGCCAFGGWQYEGSERWYLVPAVKLHDDYWNSYVIEESGDVTPVIPVKIRFWKGE